MKSEKFVSVPITDLASSILSIESKLLIETDQAEIKKLELILLNLKNLKAVKSSS